MIAAPDTSPWSGFDAMVMALAAQVDTHAKRRDVKQARPDRVGSAVAKPCAQNKSA